MGHGKKAQFAVEFSLMLALAMIMVLALAGIIYYFTVQYSENKHIKQITDLGYSLQSEIILASEVEDGYERTIVIPDKIDDVVYSIDVQGNTSLDIVLTYKGSDFLFPIPKIDNPLKKGINTIQKAEDGVHVIN